MTTAINLQGMVDQAKEALIRLGYIRPTTDDALSYMEDGSRFPAKPLLERIDEARKALIDLGYDEPDTDAAIAYLDDPLSFSNTGEHKALERIPDIDDFFIQEWFDGYGM